MLHVFSIHAQRTVRGRRIIKPIQLSLTNINTIKNDIIQANKLLDTINQTITSYDATKFDKKNEVISLINKCRETGLSIKALLEKEPVIVGNILEKIIQAQRENDNILHIISTTLEKNDKKDSLVAAINKHAQGLDAISAMINNDLKKGR
jgi:hypothetical protein